MTRRKVTRTQGSASNAKRSGAGGRSTAALVLAVVGVLALAGIFAVMLSSGDDGSSEAEPVSGKVTVTGEPLPQLGGGSDPTVGTAAPEISGEDFGGNPISIEADRRPKAIIFLAHWCSHCQAEVPVIQEWLDAQGAPADVDLYSVATAIDPTQPNYPPDAWLEREGWTPPVLVDDQAETAGQAFGVSGFPFFVFVDAEGNVTARATGELPIADLEAYLDGARG
jgi:thiol-disulfide isomerase/thioredoxin